MLYNYLNNLDKQLNETLTLYKNLARLSKPLIQYIIFIISLLVFTCCFILLFYCLTNTNVINNELTNNTTINNNLFINVILPIILYGLLCPILSTIISGIFKIFFDTLIQKIKTKHLYIKHIIKDNNIVNYIVFHKINIIYPIFYIFIYNYDNLLTYLYILVYLCIQLNRIIIFYTNSIDCKIISIEKCYNNNNNYWNFELEIDTNHKKKIINKRFNDFKKLSNNYNYNNIKLPTSSWLFTPNNINDVTKRAVELNKYIKNITNDETLLQNSVFFNFINSNTENKIEETNVVLEKTYLEESNYLNVYNNIEKLKNNCQKLINMPINEIFIINEINYYNCLKKRIIVLTNTSLIKIKYYITLNIFKIRLIIDFKNINYVEYGKIANTNTLNKKYILNIFFNKTYNIILSSLDTSYYYNVKSLIKILNENKIQINYIDNIQLNNGLGISEYILNNNITNYCKNIYYNTYLQFK